MTPWILSRLLRPRLLLSGLLGAMALGCTDTTISEVPLTIGDPLEFGTEVQDYVGYRCGSLDCHGDMGRTLRIYAERGLRAGDALRDQGIGSNEVGENLVSMAAFDTLGAPVSESLILLKALAVDAGGMAHEGGAVWDSVEAPGYQCLFAWLSGRSAEPASQAACQLATAEVLPEESD